MVQTTALAYRTARRLVRNEADASDIAHDTMVKVLTKYHQYRPEWKFSTWVATIARNTAIDWLRKHKRLSWSEVPDVACPTDGPDKATERIQTHTMVHTALHSLPPIYREVLELHHFQDLKYREIADCLDVPLGTIMNRIFRARGKMREAITKQAA
jgi:RNA polymerase sigma factor (sigma-70 family)